MTIYYSKSTNGFYNDFINQTMPSDALEIAQDLYESLLKDQNDGKVIQPDENGNPIAKLKTYEAQEIGPILSSMVQQNIDSVAISWGYDSLISAASYANSTNAQFKAEAEVLIAWRDQCWTAFFALNLKSLPENSQVLGTMLPAVPTKPVI